MNHIVLQPFHSTLLNPVQNEVFRLRHLFRRSMRTSFKNSPHREASDCLLRVPVGYPDRPIMDLYNEIECADHINSEQFRLTMALVDDIFEWLGGKELGRVMLAALGPGKKIWPHRDEGLVPHYYDRFHYTISAPRGDNSCYLMCGGDAIRVEAGELMWVNVTREHFAVNFGSQERINLIMDIKR